MIHKLVSRYCFVVIVVGISAVWAKSDKPVQHSCAKGIEDQVDTMVQKVIQGKVENRVERFAALDAALPANEGESKKLACHAVVMVTAITHNSAELPVAAHIDGNQLERVGCVKENNMNPDASKVFGKNRMSCFFLVEIKSLSQPGEFMIDWSNKRNDFGVEHFPLMTVKSQCSSQNGSPDKKAAQALIKREYCVGI